MSLADKIFGTYSERQIKKIIPTVDRIEALAETYGAMSDGELRAVTETLRGRLAAGETLDDILPDAFAAVRETADRVLGKRPFRVQLLGGIILHQGRIAEMKTGEGKTLVATMPAYLNALSGKGVHIVTVNDYLARRDSEEMGKVYGFLGLKTGLIVHGQTSAEKRAAYAADITYGTNNEIGFDYLRDNMVTYKEELTQRGYHFAIVDEVDSILIDEARTPLIISGRGAQSNELYQKAESFVRTLRALKVKEMDTKSDNEDVAEDYIVDEKAKRTVLTRHGVEKAEEFFGLENLSDPENVTVNHHIMQALHAHGVMKRDVDYVVTTDSKVLIVDAFTGRIMPGRRFSDGLHQAIEAKENVKIQNENQTLATITFQNFFRLYTKLSGMTGTALTEEDEFREIYGLDVIEVPTNKPMIRLDRHDVVYKNQAGKYRAILAQIEECHQKGQPVLVGTISVDKSEYLSSLLKKQGIPHNVLNAKQHEREAEIVAQAGKFGAVTISTNMAGRGTDIMLGGNAEFLAKIDLKKNGYSEEEIAAATGMSDEIDERCAAARALFRERLEKYKEQIAPEAARVRAAGGLFILGTERHESRRIDNQLRGRSGRQGDPGESRFYISLEDDLMRLFGSEKLMGIFKSLGVPENEQIEHKMLSSAIEKAQKKIEGNNYGIRKNLLDYDQVNNEQREIIYKERRRVLDGESMRDTIFKMIADTIDNTVDLCIGENTEQSEWDLNELNEMLLSIMPVKAVTKERVEKISKNELKQQLKEEAVKLYEEKEAEFPEEEQIRELERVVLLKVIDQKWMDHIDDMDQLREGIGLQAYGQRDPKVEYKMAAYDMFNEMLESIQQDTVRLLFHVRVEQKVEREQVAKVTGTNKDESGPRKPVQRAERKIYPNDPCPCGSGKKYKQCCGRKTANV